MAEVAENETADDEIVADGPASEVAVSEVAVSLSIGQVAERTGLSVHALRFYEREGILANPVRRGTGGHRVYGADDVEWLELCLMLRASGMPLPAIREYTGLVRQGDGNEPERLALLRQHQQRVRAQIRQLTKALDLITYKVGVYEDIVGTAAAGHSCDLPLPPERGALGP